MKAKFCIIGLSLFLFFSSTALSQSIELQKIDNELTAAFKAIREGDSRNVDPAEAHEAASSKFKKLLIRHLVNPITFHHPLENLSENFVLKSSSDKRIKFYSWDNYSAGTWHDMIAFAQFSSDNGKIVVQQLNSEKEAVLGGYTDSLIEEVHEIIIGKARHYLTFGWGTHGSGQQHGIIQIFRIEGDKLVKCKCFAKDSGLAESNHNWDTDFAIEYPRSEKLDLIFKAASRKWWRLRKRVSAMGFESFNFMLPEMQVRVGRSFLFSFL